MLVKTICRRGTVICAIGAIGVGSGGRLEAEVAMAAPLHEQSRRDDLEDPDHAADPFERLEMGAWHL